jgi:catechol 2,3-dioxygenase-like lactoylglutathione lyase family enzyme
VSAKLDQFPIDFSGRNFKPGNAWRRATVRAGYAARIEKQNATASFVAWDVRVPVQENIDILRWSIRRNVLQAEFQPASRKVENQRPLEIAVAISAHNDHGRSNRPQLIKNRFRANIAKVPDFICIPGHFPQALRQTIVRVGENKDTQGLFRLFLHVCTRKLNAPLLKTKGHHADEALEAVVNAGFEVTVPIRPLDLVNDVTQKPWPVRVAFFRGPDGELIELLEDKTGYT